MAEPPSTSFRGACEANLVSVYVYGNAVYGQLAGTAPFTVVHVCA
jgi:hypothetical protein